MLPVQVYPSVKVYPRCTQVSRMDESGPELDVSNVSSLSSGESLTSSDDARDTRTDAHFNLNIHPGLRKPLYEDSNVTTWDSHLTIMNYALRHGLTKQAVEDLLQ